MLGQAMASREENLTHGQPYQPDGSKHRTMTPKERVQVALAHREPDLVPVDFWSTSAMDAKLLRHLGLASREELLQVVGADLRYIPGPEYVGPPPAVESDGTRHDLWGVPRRTMVARGDGWEQPYEEVVTYPLADCETAADVEAYEKWPSPDWFDYSVVRQQCEECGDYCTVFEGDRLNRIAQLKPAMYLRGIDRILMDMLVAPAVFEAIVAHIRDFYAEYERRVLQAADGRLDLLMTGDDFGAQDGPIMSVQHWRSALKPGFAEFIEVAHGYGVPVMHHTCGSVVALIPDFIEAGLDVLQALQPRTRGMDHVQLKAEYGPALAFQGGISIQYALPFGTPEQVREEARVLFETMKPGGGFVACTSHRIQADTPVENALALIGAYHDFRKYSLE